MVFNYFSDASGRHNISSELDMFEILKKYLMTIGKDNILEDP